MAQEVPGYDRLQAEVARATTGLSVSRFLDLGTGTGLTARGVLAVHPEASLVGVDDSQAMLAEARRVLPEATELRVARLQDPLPAGPFDLVVSALAIHHLDGAAKADLYARVADVLVSGGRVVVGDVVVPEDPADVVTPIDGVYDVPSSAADQLAWLADAGFEAHLAWSEKDLAVLVGDYSG